MVNDGTGLLALQFGLVILITGRTPSLVVGAARLVFLTGGGIVVGLAIVMSRKSPEYMSPQVRLQMATVGDALTFVPNGTVFVLLGLRLPYVLGQIRRMSHWTLFE